MYDYDVYSQSVMITYILSTLDLVDIKSLKPDKYGYVSYPDGKHFITHNSLKN